MQRMSCHIDRPGPELPRNMENPLPYAAGGSLQVIYRRARTRARNHVLALFRIVQQQEYCGQAVDAPGSGKTVNPSSPTSITRQKCVLTVCIIIEHIIAIAETVSLGAHQSWSFTAEISHCPARPLILRQGVVLQTIVSTLFNKAFSFTVTVDGQALPEYRRSNQNTRYKLTTTISKYASDRVWSLSVTGRHG
ncbi:uncharacterized protein BYT42DRAFT_378298 [Radiomyces spectabilis]|uniref:uncharacterized protein n=1 Tax=Radiomyces spectabilis TaxID=64574 RepID=UPI0022211E38|nr:uncharacterized protein BYT42DRAFT_378298 [Radiomyces spectabilis]KAI8376208.1 hypothetical protein BYT42DRAFT_378298 [Radiomyces spectabilis]